MTPDTNPEIPSGFILRECLGINAFFLMPKTWFYRAEAKGDTRAYFMTQESILERGMFDTGLSLNAIANVWKKLKMTPQTFARSFMTTQTEMEPTSDIVTFNEGPQVVLRRHFKTLPMRVGPNVIDRKKSIYAECTANTRTGLVYVTMFEVPGDKWQEYTETAKIMVERRVLNPNI